MNIRLTEKQKIEMTNSDSVYRVMQKVLLRESKVARDKEHFWVIGLNCKLKVLFVELVSVGSCTATVVEPINVFRVAVMKNAVQLILVHSNPSGELEPSEQDKDITDQLIQVGRILRIQVIDHLIISPKFFLSFVKTGLFKELQTDSLKWFPPYELIEIIEIVRKAEERACNLFEDEKEEKREIIKGMKQQEVALHIIGKVTGLSIEEIDNL